MIFWLALLACVYFAWMLLIGGLLWKIILFVGGWFGIYGLLMVYFPQSAQIAITLLGRGYSWAAMIPTVICILALAHTKA